MHSLKRSLAALNADVEGFEQHKKSFIIAVVILYHFMNNQ
jgi:hypothetical protein